MSTILDYLNEDCWQAVLEFVPVKDVIRSERVSRKWQQVVQVYLRHARIGFKVEIPHYDMSAFHPDVCWFTPMEVDYSSFERWSYKLGSIIVATCIDTEQRLKLFGENCPNLESVMFVTLSENLLQNEYENYKRLKWLCFRSFCQASDNCISQYIASSALQDLEIIGSEQLTGQCLASIQSTNFRYLFIQQCKNLASHHLLSAADRLSGLRKFKLIDVNMSIYNSIHELLGKMPKLDHLHIYSLLYAFREPIRNDRFFEAVCELGSLKHLGTDLIATDHELTLVTRRCKELESLLLGNCKDVTGRGLAAACGLAGARLVRLGVARSEHITDDDVLACVLACPNLTDLDVRACFQLTEELWSRVRAARRPLRARTALRLYVSGTRLQNIRYFDELDGVILNVTYCGLLFDR